MKNKTLLAGTIGLALAIAIILVGCATSYGAYEGFITDPKTKDFEGSWRYMDVGIDVAYSFSASDFIFTSFLENSSVSGTYSFTAKTITFTAGDDTWTQTYDMRDMPYRDKKMNIPGKTHKYFYTYLDLYMDENSHVFGRFIRE